MIYDKLKPFIINDIFTDSDIEYLYSVINSLPQKNQEIVEELGLVVFHNFEKFENSFIEHAVSKIQPFFQEKLIPCEMYFSKYTNETNYFSKLPPHYDHKEERRITLDVQINSNIDWPLLVEEQEFTLKNNDGLVFSGTDQLHWRKNIKLKNNDFVDMFLFQFKVDIIDDLLSENDKKIQQEKSQLYAEKTGIYVEPIRLEQ